MDLTAIIVGLSGFVIGIPAIAILSYYLSKAFIDSFFKARGLAFEHELKIISQRDSIRFSKLHEERAVIIKELYQKILAVDTCGIGLLQSPTATEKEVPFKAACHEMFAYYTKHRIYFSKELCARIDALGEIAVMRYLVNSYQEHRFEEELVKDIQATWENAGPKISKILEELEDSFRLLLGVESK